jgi:hypothetical protein
MSAQRRRPAAAPGAPRGVRIAGLPHRLVTSAPATASGTGWATVSLRGLETQPLRAVVASTGELKLRLPPTTPPGTYEGTISLAGHEQPIAIEVQPHTSLMVQPSELALSAQPGTSGLVAEITVFNVGNVAAEIRRAYALGFVDVHALDHGLDEAARAPSADRQRRVDVFFDELARGSGGASRLEVEDGAGSLGPGEARAVRGRFSVPKELRVGHTYAAPWNLEDASFSIRVDVPAAPTGREVRA